LTFESREPPNLPEGTSQHPAQRPKKQPRKARHRTVKN
jgi:hypothetical protein